MDIMELPPKMSRDTFMFRFPAQLWRIINSCMTGSISWGSAGNTICILRNEFEEEYLTGDGKPFKTSKFESFVRQLNHYGFKKVKNCSVIKKVINPILHEERRVDGALLSEYYNPNFIKGKPERVAFLVRRTQGHGRKRIKKHGANEAAEGESESTEKKMKTDSPAQNSSMHSTDELGETPSTGEKTGHYTEDKKGLKAKDSQLVSARDKLFSSTVKYNMMARHMNYPQEPLARNCNYNHNKYVMPYRRYSQGFHCKPGIYGEPPPWSGMQHVSNKGQFYEDYMRTHVRVPARMSYGPDTRHHLYQMRTPEECAGHLRHKIEPDKPYSRQQHHPHWDIMRGPPGTTEIIGDVYMGRNVISGHLMPESQPLPGYGRNDAGFRNLGLSCRPPYLYPLPGHLLHADDYSTRAPFFRSHNTPYFMEREGPFQMETEFQGYQNYPAIERERPSGSYLDDAGPNGSGIMKGRDPYPASSSFQHPVNNGHDYMQYLDPNQSAPDDDCKKDLAYKNPDLELHGHLNVQCDNTAELALVVVAEETVVTSNPTTITECCTAAQNFAEEESQELDTTVPSQPLLEETNAGEAALQTGVNNEDLITMTVTSSSGCKPTEPAQPSNISLWNDLESVCTKQDTLLLQDNRSEISGSYPASCIVEEAAKFVSLHSLNPDTTIEEAAPENHITVSEVLNDMGLNVLQGDGAQAAHESLISNGSVILVTSDSGSADSLSVVLKVEKEDTYILLPPDSCIPNSPSAIMNGQQGRDADNGNFPILDSDIANSPSAMETE